VVWCEGAFGTTNGKTAHGLVRRTRRYRILSVIDSRCAGSDAGTLLDGRPAGIPIVADLATALALASTAGTPATHLVIGLAPDGGRLPPAGREVVHDALGLGLNVDSGLHDFLSDDPRLAALARDKGVTIRDVRRPPERQALHFFSGRIDEVTSLRIAVLGTDSAVGKRTTAWELADALTADGHPTEMIGTGQTAWMQGARYGLILDSVVNDFLSGEIEHAIWQAWKETGAAALVIEGQGSLMNPAYPGGHEILAAGRPHAVVMQHAPTRREYDGFPGYPLHPLAEQVRAVEMLSGRPVVAVAVNSEGLAGIEIDAACDEITRRTGLPACDVLTHGSGRLVAAIRPFLRP
jgi:uncharacterized NAD-dependent epimerase/dehydratase family protein